MSVFPSVIHSLLLASGSDSKYSFDAVAVGDIDAFIKTTRPDGKDEVGKSVNEACKIKSNLVFVFYKCLYMMLGLTKYIIQNHRYNISNTNGSSKIAIFEYQRNLFKKQIHSNAWEITSRNPKYNISNAKYTQLINAPSKIPNTIFQMPNTLN